MSISKGNGGSSSKVVLLHVTQNNSFSNYQPAYVSGGVVSLARANSLVTMGWGILANVTTTDFDIIQSGILTATGHGLGTSGTWLYVSESSAGVLTSTPPTTYSNPLVLVYDLNTLIVFPYLASKINPDLPDPITLNVRSTVPTAPTTGKSNLYTKTKFGRDMVYNQDVLGVENALQSSLWQKDVFMVTPISSTNLLKIGGDVTNNGTISHDATTGQWSQPTAATANAVCGLYFAVAHFSGIKGYHFYSSLIFPDADYGSGNTGFRAIVGLSAVAFGTSAGSDNHASERAYFAYSTNLNETNWMFSTRDAGGTERRVSTELPFIATHNYRFYIFFASGGSTVYYRVDDVTAGTTSGELSNTLNLPSNATALFAGQHICTLTTTARVVRGKKLYIESLLGV
jgi:hypothetical protein